MGVFIHFGWFVTEGKGKSGKVTCRNWMLYMLHRWSWTLSDCSLKTIKYNSYDVERRLKDKCESINIKLQMASFALKVSMIEFIKKCSMEELILAFEKKLRMRSPGSKEASDDAGDWEGQRGKESSHLSFWKVRTETFFPEGCWHSCLRVVDVNPGLILFVCTFWKYCIVLCDILSARR